MIWCQACDANISENIFAFVGETPNLRFTVTTAGVFNQYQVAQGNLLVFRVTYLNGEVAGTPTYNNCSAGQNTNLSKGIIDIELDPVKPASNGTYILINTGSSNHLKCIHLFVKGRAKSDFGF